MIQFDYEFILRQLIAKYNFKLHFVLRINDRPDSLNKQGRIGLFLVFPFRKSGSVPHFYEKGEALMTEGRQIVMAFSDYTVKLSRRIRFRYYTPREISEFIKANSSDEGK